MKKIFTSPDSTEVDLLKGIVEKEGIPCLIKNEHISKAMPMTPFYPQLWVVNDEDYERARSLVADWQRPPAPAGQKWTCPKCGESLEGQFSSCWNCGTTREQQT